jgi:hypothetical protein
MGFFSDLFNRGNRRVETLLNPLLRMKLQQFVIAGDDPAYMKHYFQFKNEEGKNEEFVVIFRRFDPELIYVHTHHRRADESFFVTLSERVWSISISHLIELGKRLSATTHPTTGHFVSNVSAGVLTHPDWVPQADSRVEDISETVPNDHRPRISVDFTPWEILSGQRDNEIGRSYEFNGLAGPGSHTRVEIICRLTPAKDNKHGVAPFIYFVVEPYILEQTGFLGAQFAPSDDPIEYRFITVKVEPIATGANFILLTDETDTDQCLSVLMLGRQITMGLFSKNGKLADFPLENDASFAQRFSELKRRIIL